MTQSSHTRSLVVDRRTTISEEGEVLSQEEITLDILVKGKEQFSTLFEKHLGTLMRLNGNEMRVLMWCSVHARLNSNEVVLNKVIKQRIADTGGISLSSVNNALTELVKRNIMIRTDTGVYTVNPEAMWKGHLSEKTKCVKLFVNYLIED